MLSESVGKAIQLTGGPEAAGTSQFTLMFDKFFDALNVSDFRSAMKSRKPFRRPYDSADDDRLVVCVIHYYILHVTCFMFV